MKNRFEKPALTVEELSHALFEVNLQLRDANRKLIEQEEQRLSFLANVSHDLRSPMTTLSNSLEYLLSQEQIDPDELRNCLLLMQKRMNYMNVLINDIFLLSSLETSDEKIKKEPVDIRFFLEDYFYMCEADSKYEHMTLELNIDESIHDTLIIDPNLMHRVLDNLFSNAVKYSKEDKYLALGAYKEQDYFIIYVQDHGVGIAKKHLSKIFNRSYRISKARTPDDDTSSGFGLAIVKTIVHRHNGIVYCESELGKGSRFIIKLPIND